MIKTKTSKEFMDLLEKSSETISEIKDDLSSVKKELSNKLKLVSNIQEFNERETAELKTIMQNSSSIDESKTILLAEKELDGQFSSYGMTILPAMSKTPNNIMNMTSAAGRIYKNNATVYINEVKRPDFIYALMDDSINSKNVAFDIFDTNQIEINIVMDPGQLLGSVKFNTIEILPYIPGSFDIQKIEIFTMQDYKSDDTTASYTINNGMKDVGISRILMENKMDLWQCKITIKLNYKNSDGKYPFGLKHIFFLNADYNTSSYVIAEIAKESYIDWISEDIVIIDQYGKRNSTCKEEGIEIYAEKVNGSDSQLMSRIKTSKGINQHSIIRNINKVYAKIPINKGIIAIKFKNIATR